MKQLSKRLLRMDYIIAVVMMIAFLIFLVLNGIYECNIDISTLGIVLCAWITQLGVSSTAYYVLVKSEHSVELPMRLVNELPDDIKQNVDLTQIITTVLTTSNN